MKGILKVLLVFCLFVYAYVVIFNTLRFDPRKLSYRPLLQSIGEKSGFIARESDSGEKPDVKYILYWTKMLSSKTWFIPSMGMEPFEKCEVSNCYITYDKYLKPIEEYDAVLFYSPAHYPESQLPKKRSPHQRYVFADNETPVRFYGSQAQYVLNDFYNWTMSYRSDSDLVRRHGWVMERETNYELPSEEFVRNKTRSVAWFVSNCYSTNKRELLGKRLQQYIDVDIYGHCGNLTCTDSEGCVDMVERNYKFYLSFENSNCKDYITEKLMRMLNKNIIPVVYGGGDYNKDAPPHSVINAANFRSAKKLASFLKEVGDDVPRYLEYFRWKKYFKVELGSRKTLCTLCEKLNNPNEPRKVYRNIKHWWWSKRLSQCKTGKELPEIVQ